MRVKIYILAFLYFFCSHTLVLHAQDSPPAKSGGKSGSYNELDELGRKQGQWRFYSGGRSLVYQVEYLNDKKHGPAQRFHPVFGVLTEEANYFDGKLDGEYKKYFASGQLSMEGAYDYGKRTGNWISYHGVNGEKKSEGKYIKGRRDGDWQFWNSKGRLILVGRFKNGVKDGAWEYYGIDGSISETKTYANDVLVGGQGAATDNKSKTKTTAGDKGDKTSKTSTAPKTGAKAKTPAAAKPAVKK